MNTTATYISELLYRYECVIMPGFGAFLTRRQPASINKATNAFFPPKKLISFNSQLQNNDGLLANYIASAEHISYTDAVAKIQRYVLSLQDKMSLGKRVEMEGIGAFFTSVENTLQFEPAKEVNYLTEAFGLTSFVSPIIKREMALSEKETPKVTREVYKKEVEALEKTTPITFTPESRVERPYLQYAAIAAIFIGAFGFFGLKYISDRNLEYNEIQMVEANQEMENKIQEATFEISNTLPAVILTASKNDNATKKEEENGSPSKISSGKYHIVAGAFRIHTNAERKVQKLRAKGFKAHLLKVNKYGLHQVVYESFSDRLSAIKALRKIKEDETQKAWLLVK